jgi:hypothetical protein
MLNSLRGRDPRNKFHAINAFREFVAYRTIIDAESTVALGIRTQTARNDVAGCSDAKEAYFGSSFSAAELMQ